MIILAMVLGQGHLTSTFRQPRFRIQQIGVGTFQKQVAISLATADEKTAPSQDSKVILKKSITMPKKSPMKFYHLQMPSFIRGNLEVETRTVGTSMSPPPEKASDLTQKEIWWAPWNPGENLRLKL